MTPEVPGFLEEEENVCNIHMQPWFYAAPLYLPISLVRITSVSRHINGLYTAINCQTFDCSENMKFQYGVEWM